MKGETEIDDATQEEVAVEGPRYTASFPLFNQSPEGYKETMLEVLRGIPGGLSFGSTVYNNYKAFLNEQ